MDNETIAHSKVSTAAADLESSLRQTHHRKESQAPAQERSHLVVVGATFTADLLAEPLSFWLNRLAIGTEVASAPYAQVLQELLNPRSQFAQNTSGFNVLLIRPEDWIRDRLRESAEANVAHLRRTAKELVAALGALRSRTPAATLVVVCPTSSSIPRVYEEALEVLRSDLVRSLRELQDVHCWTHEELVRCYPVVEYEDLLADRIGHIPYTAEYFAAMATMLARRITALVKPPLKVIAVDCDNTLWKGVCGEDGAAGIELTAGHLELQRLLVRQYEAGVLLCLCTKNNPADVEEIFKSRAEMVLLQEHFICSRINWEPKSANLRSLAAELALGIDSFIFIDDNLMECEEVRTHCPAVLTLQFPQTAEAMKHFMDHAWAFDRIGVTAEAKRRTFQYQQNQARTKARRETAGLREFLASLELKVDIAPLRPENLARAAELTARTNQFNFTTVRRTAGEVEALCRSGEIEARVVHVRDRFGDYGMVGAVFLRRVPMTLDVDTLLLSCRVLGRGVEHCIVNELGRIARAEGRGQIAMRYRQTPRSVPAREFLDRWFGQFRSPAEDRGQEVAAEVVFLVPTEYAERLSMQEGDEKSVEPETDVSDVAGASADGGAPIWHELAYGLTRIEDIVRAIRQSSPQTVRASYAYLAPRNSTEALLAGIWANLLRLPRVGVLDNFFDLGGNSLLAVQVISSIGAQLGLELSLYQFFESPTIEGLARCISHQSSAEGVVDGESQLHGPIPPRDPASGSLLPVTATQLHWWNYVTRYQRGTTQRLCYSAMRLSGPLDVEILQAALNDSVRRHEALRTTFVASGGTLMQEISGDAQCPLETVDLSGAGADDMVQVLRLAAEFTQEPLQIADGPLFAARVFRVSDREHVLILALEHMVSDDFSNQLLGREILGSYGRRVAGRALSSAHPPIQFADYALWQQQTCTAWQDAHRRYWETHLRGAPRLVLPVDRTLPRLRNPAYVVRHFHFGRERHAALSALAKRECLMLPTVFLAVYVAALSHWCNQRDVLLAFVSNGRYRPELQNIVGFLASLLHLRLIVDERDDLQSFLRKVSSELNAAYKHHDFDRVPDIVPDCAVQVAFNWIALRESWQQSGDEMQALRVQPFTFNVPWPREFLATFHETADGVVAQVTYQADSFAAATIARLGRTLTSLADEFASHPRTMLAAAFATLTHRET